MIRLFQAIPALLIVALGAHAAVATEDTFSSGVPQVALLELFTSEGCSSCPPADRWVNRLRSDPNLWQAFVPVVMHVDYWDRLGWKDPFASPAHSKRQRAYADAWQSRSVYTPGLVLNGAEWRAWRKHDAVPAGKSKPAGVIRVRVEGDVASVSFKPEPWRADALRVHVAVLESGLVSRVSRGENRGRELHHDFVAREVRVSNLQVEEGTHRGRLQLELPSARPDTRLAIAAWVTPVDDWAPLQATGGWLAARP